MKHITRSPGRFYAALFVLAGCIAFAAQPATAVDTKKGCWYEPGDTPGCNICGWTCSVQGQQCCTINVE